MSMNLQNMVQRWKMEQKRAFERIAVHLEEIAGELERLNDNLENSERDL